jgi:chemotaxis methyl-accepting protein methylase
MPDRDPPQPPAGDRPLPGIDLGRGDLTPRHAAEFRNLKRIIQAQAGLCCDGYKERVLRRRIAVRMRARSVTTFGAYAALLQKDADEFDRLIDTVTINVSKFFRNASTWMLLRDKVVPELFARDSPIVNIWSAGSAAGEEAYSMAILLLQHAQEHGGDVSRFRVVATDIDEEILLQARIAEYGPFAFTEMSDVTRDRWFDGAERNHLKDEVKALVQFDRLDLMKDPFPHELHLVMCRNVLIYFERTVQHGLFRRFHEALTPGGFLQLGKVETLFGAPSGLFETVSARERLFRRL